MNNAERIGIIVSGGPAPGINSVIASCVIEAENHGFVTYGIEDGFDGPIKRGQGALVPPLDADDLKHPYYRWIDTQNLSFKSLPLRGE